MKLLVDGHEFFLRTGTMEALAWFSYKIKTKPAGVACRLQAVGSHTASHISSGDGTFLLLEKEPHILFSAHLALKDLFCLWCF